MAKINIMTYMQQHEFIDKLTSDFGIDKDRFICYTLDSNPSIKLILFGKMGWHNCYIGFLINQQFHVLGLGSYTFINEEAKALYVSLKCTILPEKLNLSVRNYTLFDNVERTNIIERLKQLFPTEENNL
jgi:hypothetical protein